MASGAIALDVLVVGSGAAGMMAAVTAAEHCDVGLVTDRGLGTSNSAVAQGGLQLPEDRRDSIRSFREDMIRSGGRRIQADRLDHFVHAVRPTVMQLVEWGLELDRDAHGELVRLGAGGLSEQRVVTSGDRIGVAVLKVLRSRLEKSDVVVHTKAAVNGLKVAPGGIEVEAAGVSFRAPSVIVATGGRSFHHAEKWGLETSNPTNFNHLMHSILRQLGVPEIGADDFQLHPYGIVGPDGRATGKCVPESVVSLGARVVDRTGEALTKPSADRAELAASMKRCLSEGRGIDRGASPACRLLLDRVDIAALFARYPSLRRHVEPHLLEGQEVAVRPVVHYQLGGFRVSPDGSTTIPGLYLAGEVTGGLHGRNRLMGNGITEAVVDGATAGRAAVDWFRTLRARAR